MVDFIFGMLTGVVLTLVTILVSVKYVIHRICKELDDIENLGEYLIVEKYYEE